ncbi:MAG: TonB family protein [Rhizomicrobium sp.]
MISVLTVTGYCAAANADDIPTYQTLTCEKDCPVFKPAVALNAPQPRYPLVYTGMEGLYVESLVEVRFTVATNGTVKNAAIERLVGPSSFQDSVLEAVNGWTFQPATEDGRPVEQNLRRRFVFRIKNPEVGARTEVVAAYHKAMTLLGDNKLDEAAAVFQTVLAKPELNFYERCMVSFALANIYAMQKKFPEGLSLIKDATIDDGKLLGKSTQEKALRMRVRLEAANGNFSEAFAWFDILKAHADIAATDPDAKLIESMHAAINSPKPLAIAAVTLPAKTSPEAGGGIWQHTLVKRSFGFGGIDGHLTVFDLRCKAHGIESAVSDAARWTVPKSWTDCEIYVAGPPGTKFQFLEADVAAN